MLNNSAVFVSLGLLTFSRLPTTTAALTWVVCSKDEQGKETCNDRVPRGARIAMAIVCLFVLILLATLTVCIVRNRRTPAGEYNVEASQVDGPPTIIATAYDPSLGPSPVYSARQSGNPDMSGPMYPASVHQSNNKYLTSQPHHTAPGTQASFQNQSYPFVGYSPGMGPSAPKTAFVSSGFPRPLLAGDRLKDRMKDRPASVSSLSSLPAYR